MNNATFTQDKVKSFQFTLICHALPVKQRTSWKLGDGKCHFCKYPETHEHLFFYCEFASKVRQIISKEMNWDTMDIISTLFCPLGSQEQGISSCIQSNKPLTHRDNVVWHTVHNITSWHIWKARCAVEFNREEINPYLTAFAALLDVRRSAVNQILDLHHWDRWWAVRPELNFLDKKSLLSDVLWYKSMLSTREIALIPYKGLSFEHQERDSLSPIIQNIKTRYNSDAGPSLKRKYEAYEGANIIICNSDTEVPLHRNKRSRLNSLTSTFMLIRSDPGDELGTAVES